MASASRGFWWILGLLAGALLAAGFLARQEVSQVSWRDVRGVAIESDDWGLAGFIPRAHALDGIDREELNPGRFPSVYWGSTLEDSAMVADLGEILASVRGRDGLPAILQPNYVLGSLSWQKEAGQWQWRRYLWPDFSPAYRRPGLAASVAQAMEAGVWYPEFHALYHYDPNLRKAATRDNPLASLAASRGIMLFPGSEQARELAPGRPLGELAAELDLALGVFRSAFGRPVNSVIAPDYTWDSRMETLWLSRGLSIIQAKREQRFMGRRWGTVARVRKVVQQRWEELVHRDRSYLQRNCRFEPVQNEHPDQVVHRCLAEVGRAWSKGRPAIIEAHRINFVHTEQQIVGRGRQALQALLKGLEGATAGRPLFLTDVEIASLERRGVSACRRGGGVVVRNLTSSGRLVPLAAAGLPGRACWLPAGAMAVLEADGLRPLPGGPLP